MKKLIIVVLLTIAIAGWGQMLPKGAMPSLPEVHSVVPVEELTISQVNAEFDSVFDVPAIQEKSDPALIVAPWYLVIAPYAAFVLFYALHIAREIVYRQKR